jgi:hypothetical protein
MQQGTIHRSTRQWEEITKVAIVEEFFSRVGNTLAVILKLNPNITRNMTGHINILFTSND